MVNRTWVGKVGDFDTAANWSAAGVPEAGDILTIGSNDAIATNLYLQDLTIDLSTKTYTNYVPELTLNHTVLQSGTTVQIPIEDPTDRTTQYNALIQANGRNLNQGTIALQSSPSLTHLTIAIQDANASTPGNPTDLKGVFINAGTINIDGTLQIQSLSPDAQFENDGTINIRGGMLIDAPIVGTGTMTFAQYPAADTPPPSIALSTYIGYGQTINLNGDTAGIEIFDPKDFHATIAGFQSTYDTAAPLIVHSLGAEVTGNYVGNDTGGTLFLMSGTKVVDSLEFSGHYTNSSFSVTNAPDFYFNNEQPEAVIMPVKA